VYRQCSSCQTLLSYPHFVTDIVCPQCNATAALPDENAPLQGAQAQQPAQQPPATAPVAARKRKKARIVTFALPGDCKTTSSSAGSKARGRRPGVQTAWNVFIREKSAQHKQPVPTLGVLFKAEWKSMTDEQKRPYVLKAQQGKQQVQATAAPGTSRAV
jgi:LSD1 subclass zinc finger protein